MKKLLSIISILYAIALQAYAQDLKPLDERKLQQIMAQPEKQIFYFYTSWCSYCRYYLQQVKQINQDKYKLYAISLDENEQDANLFFARTDTLPYINPMWWQGDSHKINDLGFSFQGRIPYIALANEEGKITDISVSGKQMISLLRSQ